MISFDVDFSIFQVSKDGRTVLYENSAVLKLKVDKLILPIDNALTQKIGIISGVLLAVIFLILLCVFVIFAVCKRRRKRSRPPSSTGMFFINKEPFFEKKSQKRPNL